jgi:hypothetical protein
MGQEEISWVYLSRNDDFGILVFHNMKFLDQLV